MEEIAATLPWFSVLPFAGMLLSIAIFPLVKGEWWERNQLKVALFWAFVFCVPFGIAYGIDVLGYELVHAIATDYVPFIVLLFGLYTVAGGIAIKGSIAGTTKNNVILLLIGTLLASWVGTTGAAMLLIRPVLRANAWRKDKKHLVVFFIFLVANMGGCLTPLGDPPLFLGYLRGVPFFWTLTNLAPLLVLNTAALIALFAAIDYRLMRREMRAGRTPYPDEGASREKISIEGAHNIIFLAMIILGVVLNGALADLGEVYAINLFGDITLGINYFVQLALILLAAFLSLKTTPTTAHSHNEFEWGPIKEVASLFIGIFITMIPSLLLLEANGQNLGIDTPFKFFWSTGLLSSFLDNSPTYVVFLATAGALGATTGIPTTVGFVAPQILLAISAGAVFMGAMTYIGNAPNFMVKSIAESKQVKMPSFFGYIGWSLCILAPLFLLDSFLFFI